MGRQLRALREAAGLLQGDLARQIEVSQGAISKIENDKFDPTMGVVERWVASCGGRLFINRPEEGMEGVPAPYASIVKMCMAMSESQLEEARAVIEGLHEVSPRDRRLILEIVRNPEEASQASKAGS